MGFFSDITKSITGAQDPTGRTSTKAGFQLLPGEIQQPFQQFGTQVSEMFTGRPAPIPSEAEARAFEMIGAGGAPTPETLGRDVSMFMNPFDKFVIDEINREAMGKGSLISQFATQAGQQGSSRELAGLREAERERVGDIGRFKQEQFNQAIQNILGPLATAKQQDITNLLAQGQLEEAIPFRDIERFGKLLAPLPQTGGTTSAGFTGKKGADIGSTLTNVGALATMFSDRDLKENIEHIGEEKGFPIYQFNYKNDDKKYIGVMAQDVLEIMPEAVGEQDGYMTVDYKMIGVEMRVA